MYENGIDVVYEQWVDAEGTGVGTWSEHRKLTNLPGWCAGDPEMGVTLYLFGHRSSSYAVRVVDWAERTIVTHEFTDCPRMCPEDDLTDDSEVVDCDWCKGARFVVNANAVIDDHHARADVIEGEVVEPEPQRPTPHPRGVAS